MDRIEPTEQRATRRKLGFFLVLVSIVFVVEGAIMLALSLVAPRLSGIAEGLIDASTLTVISALLIWWLVVRPLNAEILADEERIQAGQRALQDQMEARDFDARLYRALEISHDEAAVLDVIARAATLIAPRSSAELLLADSSHSHLRPVVEVGDDGPPGCTVESPWDCVAVREGRPLRFRSPQVLDACPYLRDRPSGDCSAVCVPVTVLGRPAGVLHSTGPADHLPLNETVAQLRTLASQAGNRLGTIRAFAQSQLQASTDGLTGLLNRRSVEDQTQSLLRSGQPFTVLAADLDHFKHLNDTYGHDTGDRCLRLFAQTLRNALSDHDLIARYGGEEFVCVLPNTDRDTGIAAAERIRTTLAHSVATAVLPDFTVSIGVSDSTASDHLDEILQTADAALYAAKQHGRDRVMATNTEPIPDQAPLTDLASPRQQLHTAQ